MKAIATLGSGNVARALTCKLLDAGHDLVVGSRNPDRAATGDWPHGAARRARFTNLRDAASSAEVVINATPGVASLEVLQGLSSELSGKVLIDVANAVKVGPDGFASTLVYPAGSLAEEIQRALPRTHVVKTLNTMHDSVMANPTSLSAPLSAFVSGDDKEARNIAIALLGDLGWPSEWIVDLGGLATARVPESFVLMVRDLVSALGPVPFGLAIAH